LVEAELEYRQALEIDPNNMLSFRLVELLVKRGAIAEAVDLAERGHAPLASGCHGISCGGAEAGRAG
jgi:hypothetical protein